GAARARERGRDHRDHGRGRRRGVWPPGAAGRQRAFRRHVRALLGVKEDGMSYAQEIVDNAEKLGNPMLAGVMRDIYKKDLECDASPMNPQADCAKIPEPTGADAAIRKPFRLLQEKALDASPLPGFAKKFLNENAPWNYKDMWNHCPVADK